MEAVDLMDSRVFVTQEPRTFTKIVDGVPEKREVNLSPALDYGSLEVLLPRHKTILDAGFVTRDLIHKLDDFSENDFILPLGDPVVMGLVCAIASKKTGGRFTILRWDRQEGKYYPVKVNLNQI